MYASELGFDVQYKGRSGGRTPVHQEIVLERPWLVSMTETDVTALQGNVEANVHHVPI